MANNGRLDFFVGVVGALFLAHGAFSTIQYRSVLKIREEDFTYPPLQALMMMNPRRGCKVLFKGPQKFKKPYGAEYAEVYDESGMVLVEVAFSLVLCLWAALRVPGSFLPILPDAKENRVTKLSANSDFMIFNHRGKIFLPELVEAKF